VSEPASRSEPLVYPAASSENFSVSCKRKRSLQKQGCHDCQVGRGQDCKDGPYVTGAILKGSLGLHPKVDIQFLLDLVQPLRVSHFRAEPPRQLLQDWKQVHQLSTGATSKLSPLSKALGRRQHLCMHGVVRRIPRTIDGV
jgi:hypothetical protein